MAQDFEQAVRDAMNGCNKHLAHFNDDEMWFDGCHSEAKDVAVAERLIKSIGTGKHLTEFKMVTIIVLVEDVPKMDVSKDINWDAVETMAGLIKGR
jgi:hypothetical protein